jgi:hypothetical protein
MARSGLKGHTSPRGRDAGNGQFVPVRQAQQRSGSSTVERVPHPGYGADSSSPRGRDARTGHFIPVNEAERRPSTTTVERVPNPGTKK